MKNDTDMIEKLTALSNELLAITKNCLNKKAVKEFDRARIKINFGLSLLLDDQASGRKIAVVLLILCFWLCCPVYGQGPGPISIHFDNLPLVIPIPEGPQPIGVWRYSTNLECGANTNAMPDGAEAFPCGDGVVWVSTIYATSPTAVSQTESKASVGSVSSLLTPPSVLAYTGWFQVNCERCNEVFKAKAKTDRICGGYADGRKEHCVTVVCPHGHVNQFRFIWKHPKVEAQMLTPEEVTASRKVAKPRKLTTPHAKTNL